MSDKTINQIDELLANQRFVSEYGLDEVPSNEQMNFMTQHYNEDDIDEFHSKYC